MREKMKKLFKNPTAFLLAFVFIVLALYAVSVFFIFIWGTITSLKSIEDFSDLGNVLGLPNAQYSAKQLRFSNYALVLKSFDITISDQSYYSSLFGLINSPKISVNFWILVFNSMVYAVVGAVIYVFTTMTVSYVCAKYKFGFCELIYKTVIIVMIIPIVGNYPSSIALMKNLGLFNSYLGMFVQKISFAGMYFLVFYAFYQGVPDSFIEAAEIDGASQISIYIKIILPLSTKIMGTVWLLMFIDYWNNYTVALIYFPSIPMLSTAIYQVANQSFNPNPELKGAWGTPQKISACMVMAIPLIVIFIIFRNKILGDISLGGLKE